MSVVWETETQTRFNQMIEKVPIFLRKMAREKISKRAQEIVQSQGRTQIVEKDMVDAFFAETPFGFQGPMKSDMEALGIDYVKYGHAK